MSDVIVGAHVSASGALEKCVQRALDIDARSIQIFASGPQSWRPSSHTDAAIALLKHRIAEHGLHSAFLHGVYLINLASADPALVARSIASLREYLSFCGKCGARGVIFHPGSHKGAGFAAVADQVAGALRDVLAATPEGTWLILENSAGQGGTVGAKFAELGALVRAAGSDRVKVCLDTCHAYAAGYDLKTPAGVAAAVEEFDREVGRDRLVAVHANDSKAGLGSGLDRHENIGQGELGEAGFRAMLGHPAFRTVPLLLEVPGFDGGGPDRRNIETLRRIAAEVAPGC